MNIADQPSLVPSPYSLKKRQPKFQNVWKKEQELVEVDKGLSREISCSVQRKAMFEGTNKEVEPELKI